jgi:hypothetical protein
MSGPETLREGHQVFAGLRAGFAECIRRLVDFYKSGSSKEPFDLGN